MKWYKKLWYKVKVIAFDVYETSRDIVLSFLIKIKPELVKELYKIILETVKEIEENKNEVFRGEESRKVAFEKIINQLKDSSKLSLESVKSRWINMLIEIAVNEISK